MGAGDDEDEKARAHKDRAVGLAATGRIQAAVDEYLEALKLAPGDVFARQRAAELLARQGHAALAIEHYLCLVGKYASDGRLLKAIGVCHLILQLDPSHAATLATLTDLYAERDAPEGPVTIPIAMRPATAIGGAAPPSHIDPAKLERIPLFSDVPREAFPALVRKFVPRHVRAGETIVDEGQPGTAMFAIASGTVRVERRADGREPRPIAEMGEGEFFGEMSLLSHCPRLATVTAVTDCELLELGQRELEEISRAHPRIGEVLERFHRERLLANTLRASSLFRQLAPERRAMLGDLFRIDVHPPGEILLQEGRPGNGLFVLLRGECDVYHRRRDGGREPYPTLVEGDVFGEVSILQNGPVTASVCTKTPCVVLVLERRWVDELLLGHPPVRDAIYELASKRLDRTQQLIAKELLEDRLV